MLHPIYHLIPPCNHLLPLSLFVPSSSLSKVPTPLPTDEEGRVFCNICRDGGRITQPLAVWGSGPDDFTSSVPITCAQADAAGRSSFFTQDQCFVAQALAAAQGRCGCPTSPTTAPAPAGTPPSAPSPSISSPTTTVVQPTPAPVTFRVCSVCLNGSPITNLVGVIGSQTCQQVNQLSLQGRISPVICAIYQSLSSDPLDPCGCTV
jgi:hypothetical protein